MTRLIEARTIKRGFETPQGAHLAVLDGIDVAINAGEIVCLLGASGSGKTTLLNILAGLDDSCRNQIECDFTRPGPALGYLVQSDTLLPWRTIEENVALGPELLGASRAEALSKAQALLRDVGLEAFAKSRPQALSGGMKQRALLARTLATGPRLLLMDEPMSNLDIVARRFLSGFIKRYVRDTGAGALIVSHSIEEACFLADRVLILTRSPARIFKEIIIPDDQGETSMSAVAAALMHAMEARDA